MQISFADDIPADRHDAIRQAPHFQRWIARSSASFELRRVHVRDAVMFGTRIGFIFVEADALHEGNPIPKYALLRGDAVSVLVVLRRPGEPDRTLLTCEPRLPVGRSDVLSLPAGMLDGSTFSSTALRELAEEIGADLPVKADDLIELTRVWTTPGGCDEEIGLYYTELDISADLLAKLQDRATGNADEHEHIVVRVIELDALPSIGMTDAKTLLSYTLYKQRVSERQAVATR